MSSTGWLMGCLIASMVLILFLILKVKINAAISLVLGSMCMGLISGLPVIEVIGGINEGFGSMLKSIGLPIGFGIILGQLLSDFGGAKVIATSIVKKFPKSKAIYAIGIAAFVLSIPVYFDVTFVILIPIGIALIKEINKPIAYIVGAITIGAAAAHTMVPPTPAPLAAGEIFGFDIGILIAFGGIFGIIITIIAITVYMKVLDRGLWNPVEDENGEGISIEDESLVNQEIAMGSSTAISTAKLPSTFLSILPIFLPVILILLNTVTSSMMGESQPIIFQFFGDKTTALLAGAIAAYLIGWKFMGQEKAEKSATSSLSSAGIVFLITGAGGAFAKIIEISGVSGAIVEIVSGFSGNVMLVLLISYIVGLLIKQITGSGTVSAITSMTIMSSVAPSVAIPPVFIALACLSGTLFGCTVNDSGFWIVTNMSGLTFKGGFKTYTLAEMIESVICLIMLLIIASVYLLVF